MRYGIERGRVRGLEDNRFVSSLSLSVAFVGDTQVLWVDLHRFHISYHQQTPECDVTRADHITS